ncbi:unnamed protein product, partial [Urochloa humidicola]
WHPTTAAAAAAATSDADSRRPAAPLQVAGRACPGGMVLGRTAGASATYAVDLRLPAEGGALVPPPRSQTQYYVCAICFEEHPAGRTRLAGCYHRYCNSCWRGYIFHAALGDGPRWLSLRCPDPACSATVVQDLVDAVADTRGSRSGRMWRTPAAADVQLPSVL